MSLIGRLFRGMVLIHLISLFFWNHPAHARAFTTIESRRMSILNNQNTIENRTTFYDAIEDRLTRINEEFIDSGIEFKPTDEFVEEIKGQIEGHGINDYLVFIRNAKGKYDTMIENIATKMVDQNPVSPKELLNINDYLDRFLKHDTIVARWN